MTVRLVLLAATAGILFSGCSKQPDADEPPDAAAAVVEQLPTDTATLPATDSASGAVATLPTEGGAAALPTVMPDFDPASVPESQASLPPFPFFKDPEGLRNDLQGNDALKPFDRHYFIAGNKLVAQEGKIGLFQYNLESPDGRRYSGIEFQRNYENAIASLGGRKISSTAFSPELLGSAGGREQLEKYWRGAPPVPDAEHNTYLIRAPGKEYWVHVSSGGTVPLLGFVTVLEKQAMQASLAFLDAAAMRKELDAKGRVALYINFDTDKSTLRPDAQPIIEEIHKLLVQDASLKLSIEGHTDSTGGADHNRQLSGARARSVFGALVGLGVDPARLSSQGFGPDKPLADNGTDEGRAKNRRVELVKTN
jgi:outer membrane protein OmpA-like peptidoglycan-associated protein